MPHLLFRGISAELLQTAAMPLAEDLASICNCGTDNFTMSCLHMTNVFGAGPKDPPFVFIEVGWFDRGKQVRNSFAQAVTNHLLKLSFTDIEIVFITYREDSYYINGKSVEA